MKHIYRRLLTAVGDVFVLMKMDNFENIINIPAHELCFNVPFLL